MKKNLITIIMAASMLASTAAVFAEEIPEDLLNQPASAEDTLGDPIIQGDIMLIDGAPQTDDTAIAPSYISNTVTVTGIEDGMLSTTTNKEDAENPENTINFTVDENTFVFDSAKGEEKKLSDIKENDVITVFSSAYEPAPLILPPQYKANVIMVNNKKISSERFADVDTYVLREETLVNAANTLALNIDKSVNIVDKNGNAVKAEELFDKDLLVVYSTSTKSIPAQTTPISIVVLGENELALAQLHKPVALEETPAPEATAVPEETDFPVDFSKITTVKVGNETITNVYTNAEGNLMLPLRKIAETIGFTVEWDGNLRAVMLNSGMYSLKIGENSYIKGRMMPQELSVAPEITNDLTFVPVDYFTEILEMTVNLDGDNTLELLNN